MPSNQEEPNVSEVVIEVFQTLAEILTVWMSVFFYIIQSIVCSILPKRLKSVKGEICLITGAGHGIGREMALLYAKEGATVVLWDINEENVKKVVREITNAGYTKAYSYICDVANRDQVLSVAKEVEKDVGEVSILINNAGIMPTHELLDHTSEEILRIMNINVNAHFWTLEAFLPAMKRNNHGHIVCLTSTAGLFGVPNLVPYCTSKFAVRGMMEALYQELRLDKRNQIKLTSIHPYMINTGLCKRPVIRFEKLMPLVEPRYAAKEIMFAQRTDAMQFAIPRYFMGFNKYISLLPLPAQDKILDFIGAGLESDL